MLKRKLAKTIAVILAAVIFVPVFTTAARADETEGNAAEAETVQEETYAEPEAEEETAPVLRTAAEEPRVKAILNDTETRADLSCGSPESGYTYRFAVWSAENGQDDLHWISGTVKDGYSVCSAEIRNYRHTGKYLVHCYARSDANGSMTFAGETSFIVNAASCSGISVSDCNPETGAFTITAEGLTSVSGFSGLRVAVWCASDQSDLKWYTLDGDTAYCNVANHRMHTGNYIAHLYATDGNGFTYCLGGVSKKLSMPEGFYVSLSDGSIRAAVGGLSSEESFSYLNFAVWTEDKGQDDLRWYKAAGTPSVTVPVSNHPGYGKIFVHCYGVTASGKSVFVGAGTVSVEAPGAGSMEMVTDPASSDFTIIIHDVAGADNIKSVRAAVWSTGNQSNLKWYTGSKNGDGTITFTGSFDNHGNLFGTYQVHVYFTDGSDQTAFLCKTTAKAEYKGGTASAQMDYGTGILTVTVDGFEDFGAYEELDAAIWSRQNNQKDLKWVELTGNGGSYSAQVDMRSFSAGGDYLVHVYAYDAKGTPHFACNTEFYMGGLVTAAEPAGGNIPVSVSNVPNAASGTMTLKVWTKDDGSDMKEYGVPSGSSSCTVQVPVKDFGYAQTVYHIRAVLNVQQTETVMAEITRDLSPVTGSFTVESSEDYTVYKAVIDGANLHGLESRVRFAVWSEADGQDDIIWYKASSEGGKYTVSIPIRNHRGMGKYHIHVYYTVNGKEFFLQKTEFSVDNAAVSTVSVKDQNNQTGTYRLTVSLGMLDIEMDELRAAVWSKDDMSNLKWYTLTEQSDGTYAVTVNMKNHDMAEGTYFNDVYVFDEDDNFSFVGSAEVVFVPENYIVTEALSDSVMKVTIINARANGEIPDEVAFPTWSKENGQDDIDWNWTESDGSGTFSVTVDRDDYNDSGTFFTHIYGEKNGVRTFLGNVTYSLYKTGEFDAHAREVMRKILYAVETGGQVYGRCRYNDFTMAYTNSSSEHAITIGAGCWYATEAKNLLLRIQEADPEGFAANDTAGIAEDLINCNWSTYGAENGQRTILKGSEKAVAIQNIISTETGIAIQDQLIDEQSERYVSEARNMGITDLKAAMFCANVRHLGGLSAMRRIINDAKADGVELTMRNIYESMRAHNTSSNGVGADKYNSRHVKVMEWLDTYL